MGHVTTTVIASPIEDAITFRPESHRTDVRP
jgi:hypothetical protein